MSELDLHFTVTFFDDGSTWSDKFKRLDRWSERKQMYVSSSKFHNSFLEGNDEMSVIEIKEALSKWLMEKNHGVEYQVVWTYA